MNEVTEKMYKIKNDKGWEIYFRPLTDKSIEVISFYQGDPFINPRRLDKDMRDANTKENVEVWSVEEARDAWSAWVEHSDFERTEIEEYLRSGRTNSKGESINYRKSINTTKGNVTINGTPSSVAEMSKRLKGMMAE